MSRRKPREDLTEAGSRALYERPRYYDHAFRAHRADVLFYAKLAKKHRGPVLELGAGTGRVTFGIAKAGVDVVAVDRAPSMLEHARVRLEKLPPAVRGHVTFHKADLRSLRLRRRFPLVLAPFNLFMHLYTREDVERALATVTRHLAPRGRLALDVLMPDLGTLRRDPSRMYRCRPVYDPSDDAHHAYGESFDYDPVSQVQTVKMHFQRLDRPEIDRITPLSLRFYFPQELPALLHYNGFVVEQQFGDFAEGPLSAHSEHQVLIARRKD
jgi:SAM-dependent methyltransferase